MELKTDVHINQQTERIEDLLGPRNPIYPPISDAKAITLQEAQENYPFRYGVYRDLLRKKDTPLDPQKDKELLNRLRRLQFINEVQRHLTEGGGVLRDKQKIAFQSIVDGLEKGIDQGYLKLPTGFGKTVMFTVLSELAVRAGLRVVIEVPTKILLKQTQKKGFMKFAPDIPVGLYYGDEAKDDTQPVTLTTYDSFENLDPEQMDLLILDEAHRGFSDRRQGLTQRANSLFKIGFTATPDASEERTLDRILPHRFHAVERRDAVKEGILSPYRVLVVKTEADLSKVKLTEAGEYNAEELDKAINTATRNKAAVAFYKQAFDGKSAVAYCNSVAHAQAQAEEFIAAGVPAAAMHGEMTQTEREDLEAKHEQGEIKVLCNMKLLIEGWDQPKASVCLNLSPTLSLINADQRGGRVLRLNEEDPDKIAYIVEFIDKNDNPRTQPILFSHLDDVALAPDEKREEIEGRSRELNERLANIHIEGLEIVFEEEEVLRISREIENKRPKDVPEGWIALARMVERSGRSSTFFMNRLKEGGSQKIGGALYIEPNKASELMQTAMNYPPEGSRAITAVAQEAGISITKVRSILEEHDDDPTYAGYYPGMSNTGIVYFITPKAQELVVAQAKDYITEGQRKVQERKDREAKGIYSWATIPKGAFGDLPAYWVEDQLRQALANKDPDIHIEGGKNFGTSALIQKIKERGESLMGNSIRLLEFTAALKRNGVPERDQEGLLARIRRERPDVLTTPFQKNDPHIDRAFADYILSMVKKK